MRALAVVLCCAGCAGVSPSLWSPPGTHVYVAPFVDQTPGMRLGMAMTTSLQDRLYARAPDRFLVVFDDAAVAVDGTVIAVEDVHADRGKRDVIVKAELALVDKRGRVRHETGIVERRARYETSADVTENARRRDAALAIATSTVGRALADLILRVP
ncbi:MAG: LPS assembly lipoprotein LptE [Deltaproteobacteria bacterium]|nr:LPS assembly lipoprotein LptE [Deltaproteobacteria bacterium]